MPAESARLFRRVRPRDRLFVGVVLAATAIGAPIGIVVSSHSGAALAPGCVSRIEPGFMGGQTATYCGKRAATVCRDEATPASSLGALCRKQGFAIGRGR
jgi:hypothetical protein